MPVTTELGNMLMPIRWHLLAFAGIYRVSGENDRNVVIYKVIVAYADI
jgi:hypothetical protein